MIAIAIDPGVSGAIAAVKDGRTLVALHEMPVLRVVKNAKVSRSVDGAGLARIVREIMFKDPKEYYASVVEKTSSMSGQGVASTYSMGHSRGVAEGVLLALNLPMDLVAPAVWKRQMKLTNDKEYVRGQVQMQFPEADLSRKKDHDKAEAIALAVWLWEQKFK